MVIATKFLTNMYRGDPNGGGASRKAIVAQCEQSLRRLQTDYIDLYWMHAWDATVPIDETLRALDDLVRDGKVRFLGFSDAPAWKCAQAQTIAGFRGWAPLIALQIASRGSMRSRRRAAPLPMLCARVARSPEHLMHVDTRVVRREMGGPFFASDPKASVQHGECRRAAEVAIGRAADVDG